MEEAEAFDVCIVGGGMSGLQCLRAVARCGLRAVVLEKQADVGGVWCQAYANLAIQVPKQFYQLAEFPVPAYMEEYPTAPSLKRYITEYAERFNLGPHVRTNCRVLKMAQRTERKDWEVSYHYSAPAPSKSRVSTQCAPPPSLLNSHQHMSHCSDASAAGMSSPQATPPNSGPLCQVMSGVAAAGDSHVSGRHSSGQNMGVAQHGAPHCSRASGQLPVTHPNDPPHLHPHGSFNRSSVLTAGGNARTGTIIARFVVVCTGLHTQPNLPDLHDRGVFVASGGEVLHAGSFTNLQCVAGKHVVVVGGGKAAVDIACEVAGSGLAASCTAVFRQVHWPVPRARMWGSRRATFAEWANSRAPLDVLPPYYTAGKLEQLLHAAKQGSKARFWQGVQEILAASQGLQGDMLPTMDMPKDVFHGGVVHDGRWSKLIQDGRLGAIKGEVVRYVAHGVRVKPVAREGGHMAYAVSPVAGDGDAESTLIGGEQYFTAPGGGHVTLAQNGSLLRADLVIFATGYTKRYTFFDSQTQLKLDLQRDGMYLYRSVIPPGVPNLAFIGSEINSFNNPLTIALQCAWLRHALQGKVVLPCTADMRADCAAQAAWKRVVMPPQLHRSAMTLLYMQKYHDQLCEDMGYVPRSKLPACCGGLGSRGPETPVTMADFSDLFESGSDVVVAPTPWPKPAVASTPQPTDTAQQQEQQQECQAEAQQQQQQLGVKAAQVLGADVPAAAAQQVPDASGMVVTSPACMVITDQQPCVVGGEAVVVGQDGAPVPVPQTMQQVQQQGSLSRRILSIAAKAAGSHGALEGSCQLQGAVEDGTTDEPAASETTDGRSSLELIQQKLKPKSESAAAHAVHASLDVAAHLLVHAKAVLHLHGHSTQVSHTPASNPLRPKQLSATYAVQPPPNQTRTSPQTTTKVRSCEQETVGPLLSPAGMSSGTASGATGPRMSMSRPASAAALRHVVSGIPKGDELVCTSLIHNKWTAEYAAATAAAATEGLDGPSRPRMSTPGQPPSLLLPYMGPLGATLMSRHLRYSETGRDLQQYVAQLAEADDAVEDLPAGTLLLQHRRGRARRLSAPLQAAAAYLSAVAHRAAAEHGAASSRSSTTSRGSRPTGEMAAVVAGGPARPRTVTLPTAGPASGAGAGAAGATLLEQQELGMVRPVSGMAPLLKLGSGAGAAAQQRSASAGPLSRCGSLPATGRSLHAAQLATVAPQERASWRTTGLCTLPPVPPSPDHPDAQQAGRARTAATGDVASLAASLVQAAQQRSQQVAAAAGGRGPPEGQRHMPGTEPVLLELPISWPKRPLPMTHDGVVRGQSISLSADADAHTSAGRSSAVRQQQLQQEVRPAAAELPAAGVGCSRSGEVPAAPVGLEQPGCAPPTTVAAPVHAAAVASQAGAAAAGCVAAWQLGAGTSAEQGRRAAGSQDQGWEGSDARSSAPRASRSEHIVQLGTRHLSHSSSQPAARPRPKPASCTDAQGARQLPAPVGSGPLSDGSTAAGCSVSEERSTWHEEANSRVTPGAMSGPPRSPGAHVAAARWAQLGLASHMPMALPQPPAWLTAATPKQPSGSSTPGNAASPAARTRGPFKRRSSGTSNHSSHGGGGANANGNGNPEDGSRSGTPSQRAAGGSESLKRGLSLSRHLTNLLSHLTPGDRSAPASGSALATPEELVNATIASPSGCTTPATSPGSTPRAAWDVPSRFKQFASMGSNRRSLGAQFAAAALPQPEHAAGGSKENAAGGGGPAAGPLSGHPSHQGRSLDSPHAPVSSGNGEGEDGEGEGEGEGAGATEAAAHQIAHSAHAGGAEGGARHPAGPSPYHNPAMEALLGHLMDGRSSGGGYTHTPASQSAAGSFGSVSRLVGVQEEGWGGGVMEGGGVQAWEGQPSSSSQMVMQHVGQASATSSTHAAVGCDSGQVSHSTRSSANTMTSGLKPRVSWAHSPSHGSVHAHAGPLSGGGDVLARTRPAIRRTITHIPAAASSSHADVVRLDGRASACSFDARSPMTGDGLCSAGFHGSSGHGGDDARASVQSQGSSAAPWSASGPQSTGSTNSPGSRVERYAARMQMGADATLVNMAVRVSSNNLSAGGAGSGSGRARKSKSKSNMLASATLRHGAVSRSATLRQLAAATAAAAASSPAAGATEGGEAGRQDRAGPA